MSERTLGWARGRGATSSYGTGEESLFVVVGFRGLPPPGGLDTRRPNNNYRSSFAENICVDLRFVPVPTIGVNFVLLYSILTSVDRTRQGKRMAYYWAPPTSRPFLLP